MAYLDRREPGVYVDIEDHSYVAETVESGRTVYAVILCDRGPSDQIVRVTSRAQFHKIFGAPNFLRTSQTHYQVDAALGYSSNVLVVRAVPDDSYLSNIAIQENTDGVRINALFDFTNDSKEVTMRVDPTYGSGETYGEGVDPASELNKVQIGSWIYAEGDDTSYACQVVSRYEDGETIKLVLDRPYPGGSLDSGYASIFVPYSETSMADVKDETYFTNPQGNIVYYFHATGTGKYYDNLCIRGTRNTDLEKYHLGDDPNDPDTYEKPLYKYLFMDIGVYERQDNGNYILVEGPWTVSLIPRYPGKQMEQVIDPTTGGQIYIENVINDNSNLIRCISSTFDVITEEPNVEFPAITKLIGEADEESRKLAENARLQVMLMLSSYTPIGTNNITTSSTGLIFKNGADGTGLYNISGNIQPSTELLAKVGQCYSGKLTKNGIDQLREQVYYEYAPDYVVSGGYPPDVQYEAMELCQYRQTGVCLADTGAYYNSPEKDLEAREKKVPWNSWCAMLYTQYRRINDNYTGRKFWVSPVYHAIQRHLYCDAIYFISEPVAGIEKGSIDRSIVLAYKGNHTTRGDFCDVELNPTISEPDGTYILTQFTTWKQYSVLKRGHVAKFVCYVKKAIPPLLKDILQRKATAYWINEANIRINSFLNNFMEGSVERYSTLRSFAANVTFDDQSATMDVTISLRFIRAIERINVVIAVE